MEGSLPKIPFGINGREAQSIFKILNVSINTVAQRVKALAAKPEDLSSIPWKERTNRGKLYADVHTQASTSLPITYVHTINKCNLKIKKINTSYSETKTV